MLARLLRALHVALAVSGLTLASSLPAAAQQPKSKPPDTTRAAVTPQQPACTVDCGGGGGGGGSGYNVSVTPDGAWTPTRPPYTGGWTASFTVQNTGTTSNTFAMSCGGLTTNVTCTALSPTSVSLLAGASRTVTTTYSVGEAGTGGLRLQAVGTSALDAGYYNVPVKPPYGVAVTPDGASTPERLANTGGYSATFTVQNSGSESNTYTLSCGGSPNVTCTGLSATSVPLATGASATVTATYSVGAPGSGTLTLTAVGTSASDGGSYTVPVVSYGVAVTPDGATTATRAQNAAGYAEVFTVRNTGSKSNTYTLSCAGAAPVTCTGTAPTSLTLAGGATGSVTASYYTGPAGTGRLTLAAAGTQASDTGSFSVLVEAAGVSVSPDSADATARLANTGPFSEVFTIRNTGAGQKTFTITCSGSSNVTCSSTSTSSVALLAGASTTVTATYSVGAVGAGKLTLTATGPDAIDAGSYNIGVVSSSQQAPTVDVAAVNPGNLSERDLCFTVALGQAAASECGDLRIVHSLPTTRTMNKARTPMLLYNSQFAHPYPLVAALVTLPTTAIPDSIEAVLKLNGTSVAAKRWRGADWAAGTTRRVVVGLDGDTLPTGIYPYTLEVASIYLSTPSSRLASPAAAGQLVIVNRKASPFGAGWWLAGLEQLNVGTKVWVGGDGSVRPYQQVPGTTDKWIALNVDHPDTLKRVVTDSTYYVRYLPGGVEVWFNEQGKHRYSYNRQRHRTAFSYDPATGLLTSIMLPTPYQVRTYDFAYTTSAPYRLTSVTAPDYWSEGRLIVRRTRVTQPTGFITQIQNPDGKYVQFAPHPTVPELIQSRTDRRGTELTFRYDTLGGRKVAGSSLNMGVGASPIVLTITPQQSFGLKRAVAPAAAFTLIDGPRTDSADVTKVWQDRLGQPALIENAHGFTTGLRRDATWPALVAEVVHANGWRVTATYDLRGNVASTTDHGIGGSPTTTYEWDQKWDALTKIKQPEGDSVVMMYDAATGNRLWQQDGRGSATRVNFGYNSANQLITIAVPGTPAESIGYQPFALGNVEWTKTPKKFDTRYTQDDIGRITQVDSRLDTLVNSPPSCGCWIYQTTLTYHDIMDRDSIQVAIGPQDLALGVSPETLFVRNFYNGNGQLDSLWRWSSPDPANIDTIRTEWRYDAPGRVVAEVAPDGYKDSTVYDPAGNADTLVTRRGHVITMVYDALNRLVSRSLPQVNYPSRPTNFHIQSPKVISAYSPYTIPAETHTFTYDALGRLLTADNADAKVKRAYLPNGLLDTDSLWIQTVNRDDWNKHVYGLRSTYDRDGRRLVLAIPQQLAASGATTISYVYDRGLGALQTAYDLQGARYDFSYNARGELNSLTYPSQYGEVFHYDSDGRLSADTLRNTGGTAFPRIEFALVRASNYAYDARDLVLWSGDPVFFKDTLRATYSGLGHLLKSQLIQHGHYIGVSETGVTNSPARYTTVEQYALDALVNRTQGVTRDTLTTSSGYWTSSLSDITSTYERGTGRLLTDRSVSVRTNYSYDSAGSVVLTSNMGDIAVQSPAEERASFFAADGSLRAVDSRWAAGQSASILSVQKYTFEEYRYDALGRRIWLRAQKWCNDVAPMDVMQATDCRTSPLRRTIWDGNQELAEIQMPWGLQSPSGYTISTTPTWWENDINPVSLGTLYTNQGTGDANPYFGHVVYTAGRGIDQPVAITRVNYVMALDLVSRQPYSHVQAPFTIMPFWNARGDAPGGVFSNGAGALCDPPTSQTACVGIKWPWTWSAYDRQLALARIAWHGTLLESRRDHSGLGYMRNRYYDPKSGRFTQEDPLGLAGGLNLYGFAGGDPVNFSDPFGLCPIENRGNCTQADVGSTAIAAAQPCNISCREEQEWTPENTSPGLIDPVAIGAGGLAGGVDALLAGSAERSLAGSGARILANKARGDVFRDEIAAQFERGGYQVEKEVVKRTPFGARRIDIEVSRGGKVLGGIETKSGASRYTPWQMAKDAWLKLSGYIVQLVRGQ